MPERLSKYLVGYGAKRLSGVEINRKKSHQHEVNGIEELRKLLGTERRHFSTKYIYLGELEEDTVVEDGDMTWYDARENHATRTEHRLYYVSNGVMNLALEGDLLVIALKPDDTLLTIVVKGGTTSDNEIMWLFGIKESTRLIVDIGDKGRKIGYAERVIMEQIGIDVIQDSGPNYLDSMINKFGCNFPDTKTFSAFSRDTIGIVSMDDPDEALITWLEREELLFRTFERHLLAEKIKDGFDDVDAFLGLAIGAINRRKSRVGRSFENHLRQIFVEHGICFSEQAITEHRSKPDFVFPSIDAYHRLVDDNPQNLVTILGVKYSCKDRWRQILAEADKVKQKFVATMEFGISQNQTDQMEECNAQLVVPKGIHNTYKDGQRPWLMNLQDFLGMLIQRQSRK